MASRAFARVCYPCRRFCLPVLSLTRSPGGRHLEWSSAFFEPMFDMCERGVWFVGLLCFMLVLTGISAVAWTMYVYIVPFLYQTQHPMIFALYFIYGHYLLMNICYHYYRGVYTSPGTAPKVPDFDPDTVELRRGWKVCRRCDAPKPPRAHHCRICDRCVLKMDHHCPWMFNCIGHYNHRYFMSFVVFMWMGTCYVVNCMWSRVFLEMKIKMKLVYHIIDLLGMRSSLEQAAQYPTPSHSEVMFLFIIFFVCLGVTCALTILGGWHVYLISTSTTTIEFYTNRREANAMKKEGKVWVNPYYYGCRNNWLVFMGLIDGQRSFFRHILLPSSHKPHHDGLDWHREDVLCFKDKLRTIPV